MVRIVSSRTLWTSPWIPAGLFPAGLVIRALWSSLIPPGRSHDACENALAAAELWSGGADLLFTRVHGLDKEPLFHALVSAGMAVADAERALTWTSLLLGAAALPATWALLRAAGLRGGAVVGTAWLAFGAWPVIYSLVGFRAVAALPLAGAGMAGALSLVQRARDGRPLPGWLATATAVALTTSLYAYTSARLVCAWTLVWLVACLLMRRPARLVPALSWLALGCLPGLPWLLALLGPEGRETLLRGGYVFLAEGAERNRLFLDALWMPAHMGFDYAPISRPGYIADGASAVFPLSGLPPLAIPVTVLLVLGLLSGLWSSFTRAGGLAPTLVIGAWAAHLAVLGAAGPSTTRFLLVLPSIALLLGWGVERGLERSRAKPGLALAICALLAGGCAAWESARLTKLVDHPHAWSNFPDAVMVASELAVDVPDDRSPVVVVPRARSVVELAALRRPGMQVVEFHHAAGALADLPPARGRPVYLVVRHPNTDAILEELQIRHPSGSRTRVPGADGRTFDGLTLEIFDPEGAIP